MIDKANPVPLADIKSGATLGKKLHIVTYDKDGYADDSYDVVVSSALHMNTDTYGTRWLAYYVKEERQ